MSLPAVLLFAYGNVSRGDDGLAPLLLEAVEDKIDSDQVECLTDFQLQVEHALDLKDRRLVMFIDASVACQNAYSFVELKPQKDSSYTSHAVSPSSVLQVYQDITKRPPPPCFLLSIQGLEFELGQALTQQAQSHLQQAIAFTEHLLQHTQPDFWRKQQG